jgi:hypothetical protein
MVFIYLAYALRLAATAAAQGALTSSTNFPKSSRVIKMLKEPVRIRSITYQYSSLQTGPAKLVPHSAVLPSPTLCDPLVSSVPRALRALLWPLATPQRNRVSEVLAFYSRVSRDRESRLSYPGGLPSALKQELGHVYRRPRRRLVVTANQATNHEARVFCC